MAPMTYTEKTAADRFHLEVAAFIMFTYMKDTFDMRQHSAGNDCYKHAIYHADKLIRALGDLRKET